MIFALLPSLHLGVVQQMTSNKEALISIVNKMRGNPTLEAKLRNNEKEILNILYQFQSAGSAAAGEVTERGASSRSPETIQQARALAITFASQEESLSKLTLNSFLSIADHLSGNHFEGRVVMIWVSGGFSMRPGEVYFDILDKAVQERSITGTEDLAYQHRPDTDIYNEVTQTIGFLNRLNVTIYSVDATGLIGYDKTADRDARQAYLGADTLSYSKELQDSLVKVAYETGGTAIINTQNFKPGLDAITQDMNQQYWLCSSVPPSTKKGAYHKIQVKVSKPDLNVRYRQGYVE
jgi:VWFA-related protein